MYDWKFDSSIWLVTTTDRQMTEDWTILCEMTIAREWDQPALSVAHSRYPSRPGINSTEHRYDLRWKNGNIYIFCKSPLHSKVYKRFCPFVFLFVGQVVRAVIMTRSYDATRGGYRVPHHHPLFYLKGNSDCILPPDLQFILKWKSVVVNQFQMRKWL